MVKIQVLEIPLEDIGFDIGTFPNLKFPYLPDGKRAKSFEELIQCSRVQTTSKYSELFDDIKKRKIKDPILVFLNESDRKYRIVDGYRRYFMCEKLNEEYPGEGWDKIPARIVFEKEPTEKEFREYQRSLQLSPQINYEPIDTMLKIREGKDAGLSNKEIAGSLYGVKENEIEDWLDRLKLVERYLEHINAPKRYSLARGKDIHFINLQAIITNAKQHGYDHVQITNIKTAVFELIFEGKKHKDIRKLVMEELNKLKNSQKE
jgi:ParB-like chromosome segregation protein Spo0J